MSVFIGYPSFMAYQMMKGKKGNNDDFPSIPGTIARYSALGLTNEEMSKNPVWVDKTGNGHDIQLKNFAWSGMSPAKPTRTKIVLLLPTLRAMVIILCCRILGLQKGVGMGCINLILTIGLLIVVAVMLI